MLVLAILLYMPINTKQFLESYILFFQVLFSGFFFFQIVKNTQRGTVSYIVFQCL